VRVRFGHLSADFPMGLFFKNVENNIKAILDDSNQPENVLYFKRNFVDVKMVGNDSNQSQLQSQSQPHL